MDILEEKSVLGKTYGSKLRPDYVSPYHTDKKHIIGFTKKHGSKSKGMDGRKENATKKSVKAIQEVKFHHNLLIISRSMAKVKR